MSFVENYKEVNKYLQSTNRRPLKYNPIADKGSLYAEVSWTQDKDKALRYLSELIEHIQNLKGDIAYLKNFSAKNRCSLPESVDLSVEGTIGGMSSSLQILTNILNRIGQKKVDEITSYAQSKAPHKLQSQGKTPKTSGCLLPILLLPTLLVILFIL